MRLLGLAGLVLTIALAGCGSSDSSSSSSSGSGGGQTITVSLTEFRLDPSQISVQKPGTYTFHAVNDGQYTHALEIEGHGVEEKTDDIQPGDSADLKVDLKATGDYEIYCPVDGHRGKGMEGSLAVGGSTSGAGATTTNDSGNDGGGYGG